MPEEKKIGNSSLKLIQDDITLLDVEAFVFYARPDLQLGSGYGNAISMRGGPTIQTELNELGQAEVTKVVTTAAGKLKAKQIFHAVGPAFQEEDVEEKLRTTIKNALRLADETGVSQLAFPAMGVGFYGIPLEESGEITLGVIKDYLQGKTKLKEVIVCLNDSREYKPFQAQFSALG